MRRSLIVLILATLAAAPGARAATLAPVQIYTDPVADGVVLGPALPPQIDLIAGTIAETDLDLIITWELVDIPDGTKGIPEGQRLDFEFAFDFDPASAAPPNAFGVRLVTTRSGTGTSGWLDGNCVQGTPVTCTKIANAFVATSVDAAADTFTAVVRRQDLKKAGGVSLAVDGAELTEFFMYRGIASYLGVPAVVVTHNLSDQADLTAPYILGQPR